MNTKFQYGFYADSLNECFKKFGDIFSLPIISNPYYEALNFYSAGNILDMGAGKNKIFKSIINDRINDGNYYSLDNDPMGSFDFNHIQDIPETLKFKFILANQFFEHLTVEDSLELFKKIDDILDVNGIIIVTVPNISHPNRHISNIDHKTAWGYNSLYMLYRYANFEVIKIARYSKRHPKGIIEKTIAKYISRIYRMDWCDSIFLVGQKHG